MKGAYVLQMARHASIVANRLAPQDDKDHYSNKRVKYSGQLMEELFTYAFRFFVKDVKYQIERASARGRKLSIPTIISPETITEKIAYAMGTGTWVAGQTGVSQVLDRTNLIHTYADLRRVKSPLAKKHPHFAAREVHGTQWGKICISETPEGLDVGPHQVPRPHGEDQRWRRREARRVEADGARGHKIMFNLAISCRPQK